MRPPLSSGWRSSVLSQSICTLGRSRSNAARLRRYGARHARALSVADDRALVFAVEEDPLPHLEIDQRPETLGVIRTTLVRRDELPNDCRLEQVARRCALAEHVFVDQPAIRTPQPAPQGNREAHLPPLEDRRWKGATHRLAQDMLCRPAAQLEPSRQRGREFREGMIEKWHPTLDRGRHAHLILFHEQLVEIRLRIHVQETIE